MTTPLTVFEQCSEVSGDLNTNITGLVQCLADLQEAVSDCVYVPATTV